MAIKYLHNTSYNDKYPWRPAYFWDHCPACFERFDFTPCENCGSGHSEIVKTKGERVVVFANGDGCPCLLTQVKRDKTTKAIKSGWVVNGEWYLTIEGDKLFCSSEPKKKGWAQRAVHIETIQEIVIPNDVQGHYNALIKWAEAKLQENKP